ncbi:MAG: glycosyltransferase [Planctomycetales bacterium]|nr:glycosyltransferase [Planctomycetales bacterium]
MRILLITEASDAGVGRHFLDLAEGLLAAGHEVHLVYSSLRLGRNFARRVEGLCSAACCVVDMRRGPHPSDFHAVLQTRRYIRDRGPFDVIHGHSSKGGAIARLAGVGSGSAVLYTPHAFVTMDPNLSAKARFIYGAIERVLGWLSSSVVALTGDERAAIARAGVRAGKIAIVPNSIAPPEFLSRAEARQQLGLPREGVTVGFVGRLFEQKDPQLLLRAFAQVADLPELPILGIIGDGPLRGELEGLIREFALEGKVHLLGEHPAAPLMRAFDIYAMSSLYEGMPYVLLEAMAASLPIVSTVVSSSPELIDDGVSGLLVRQRTPEAFAAALRQLIVDESKRNQFAAEAARRAAGFTLEEMIETTVDLYRDMRVKEHGPIAGETRKQTEEVRRSPVACGAGESNGMNEREPTC